MAARFVETALRHQGLLQPEARGFKFVEAADIDKLCRDVLRAFKDGGPEHIFGDILERLCLEELAQVRALVPTTAMYRDRSPEGTERIQEAHAAIGSLLDHSHSFRHGDVGTCSAHAEPRQCPFWTRADDNDRSLTLVVAGVTCKDVSTMGLRRRRSGPHWVPLKVFYAERRARQEDLILIECTEHFDFEEAMEELGHVYQLSRVQWGPQDVGVHVRRRRCWVLMHSKASMVEVAGIDAFTVMFGRAMPSVSCESRSSKGDAFFCAPDSAVQDALTAEGRRAGLCPPYTWRDTLSAATLQRLQTYEHRRKSSMERRAGVPISDAEFAALVVDMGPSICDLTQNADARGREAAYVPTLLRATLLWSHVKGRPLLGQEALVCQGVPVYERLTAGGLFRCPYEDMIPQLSQGQLRGLAGNAICVPIVGSLLAFMLASLERREHGSLSGIRVSDASHMVGVSGSIFDDVEDTEGTQHRKRAREDGRT